MVFNITDCKSDQEVQIQHAVSCNKTSKNKKRINKTKTVLHIFLINPAMHAHLRLVYYGKYAEQISIKRTVGISVRLYEVELVYSGQSQWQNRKET